MGDYHRHQDAHTLTPEAAGQLIKDARNAGYNGDIIVIINGEFYEIKGGANNGK